VPREILDEGKPFQMSGLREGPFSQVKEGEVNIVDYS